MGVKYRRTVITNLGNRISTLWAANRIVVLGLQRDSKGINV